MERRTTELLWEIAMVTATIIAISYWGVLGILIVLGYMIYKNRRLEQRLMELEKRTDGIKVIYSRRSR